MQYAEKLKDPRWQKRRLHMMEKSSWSCDWCGDESTQLNVHHRRYIKGFEPWDYEDDDLAVLCDPCHRRIHRIMSDLEFAMARMPFEALQNLSGYAACLSWWGNGFKKYTTEGCSIGGMMAFMGIRGSKEFDFVASVADENMIVDIGQLISASYLKGRY